MNADSPVGDCNGIYIYCDSIAAANAPLNLSANAYGASGTIIMGGYGTDWTSDLSCSANNLGSGNGGVVTINAMNNLIPQNLNISANGGTDGTGGTITISNIGTVNFSGTVEANGQGSGARGQINIQVWNLTPLNSNQNVNADALGDGNGGSINVTDVNAGNITIGT